MSSESGYFVVKDVLPVEDGGLKDGTYLTHEQVRVMVSMGSFLAGTILRKRKQFFRVTTFTTKKSNTFGWRLELCDDKGNLLPR